MRPNDCFEMEGTVTTTKAPLTNHIVPAEKTMRKVYSWFINNQGSAIAGVTFTIERDAVPPPLPVRTIPPIVLGAFDSLDEQNSLGLITIPSGLNIKAQITVGTGPMTVILRSFDV